MPKVTKSRNNNFLKKKAKKKKLISDKKVNHSPLPPEELKRNLIRGEGLWREVLRGGGSGQESIMYI